jgi:tripartite-type tricarboxylate transporter receptor subunit TctC
VFSQTRVSSLPDVPSAVEAGVPDLVAEGFAGVSVRAGTPREIVAKLATDFRLVAHLPEVRRQLDEPGTTIIGSSPEEYRRFLAAETARWAKTIRTYGIRAE